MSSTDNKHAAKDSNPLESLAVIRLKLPSFRTKKAKVWFGQVEGQFQLHRFTPQAASHFHVVSSLPAEIADELEDILMAAPTPEGSDNLKAAILDRKTPWKGSQLQHLLNMKQLGGQRPSQPLRRMRRFLGYTTSDADT